MGAKKELKGVESNLVFLDVRIHKNHRFNLVVDAVPDEVEFQNELLAEYKSEVGLTEKLVEEGVVLLDQLVEDVLQDRSDLRHLEALKPSLILDLLIHFVVEGNVLQRAHFVGIAGGSPELPKYLVARVDDKFEIRSATLFIEEENELIVEAQPIKKHHSCPNQLHVFVLFLNIWLFKSCVVIVFLILDMIGEVVLPDDF